VCVVTVAMGVARSFDGPENEQRGSDPAVDESGIASPRFSSHWVTAYQRTAGNAATVMLLRQATADAPTPPAQGGQTAQVRGILDGVPLSTYADAANFVTPRLARVVTERTSVAQDGVGEPPALATAQREGQHMQEITRAGGQAELDEATFEQVSSWFDQANSAISLGELARSDVAVAKLRQFREAAQAIAQKVEDLRDKLADAQRDAYAKEKDKSRLSKLLDASGKLLHAGLALHAAAEAGEEEERSLLTAARVAAAQAGPNVGRVDAAFELPEAGKLAPFLEKVHLAMDAIEIAKATAEFLSEGTSEAATASKKTGAAVSGAAAATTASASVLGLAGAGASLVAVVNGTALMMNNYLVPLTEACLKAEAKLEDVGKDINKDLIEEGLYDKVNWSLEPGGRPVFDFMMKVMAAASADEVPKPVPPEVAKYFVAHREEIGAGAADQTKDEKDENEPPTSGFWFWRHVEEGRIEEWVLTHRVNLWSIFYGSAKPGSRA
jgi:hypothetical protein